MSALGKTAAARATAISLAAGARLASAALAGPYSGPAGAAGSDAVAHDDTSIVAWASGVAELVRGPAKITDLTAGYASFGAAADALGPCVSEDPDDVYDVVSLGDGGSITLTFDRPIRDGEGWDFAVFENGFTQPGSATGFLELAFVEVSSDGVNFFRFPAVSLTPTATQVGPFAWIDPTNLHNLAGKYVQGWGTPFDLSDLAGVSPLLDVNAVTHVRIIDVVGTINPAHASLDSLGNIVNDPWPTTFNTGGFDLDAVGVRHVASSPQTGYAAWLAEKFTAAELADEAISGPDADPDADGLPNLLEYALGGAPLDPADGPALAPRAVYSDGRIGLAYRPAAGIHDLLWSVEWSSDLAIWDDGYDAFYHPEADPATPVPPPTGDDVVLFALHPLSEMPRQFLRLRVSILAP